MTRTGEAHPFGRVLGLLPDAVLLVDQAGQIVYANAPAEVLFGYPAGALIGRGVEELVPEQFRSAHAAQRAAYAAQPKRRTMGSGLDLRGRRQDGSSLPVDIMLGPVETEEGLCVLAVVRDLSVHKAAEMALRQKNASLEHLNRVMMEREERIVELKREVNGLRRALKQPTKYLVE